MSDIQLALGELRKIQALLDSHDQNPGSVSLQEVSTLMKDLLPRIKFLTSRPEVAKSPEFIELTNGFKVSLERVKLARQAQQAGAGAAAPAASGTAPAQVIPATVAPAPSNGRREGGLLRGYLNKQGEKGFKAYRRRWFAQFSVDPRKLYYFADQSEDIAQSKGSIDLPTIVEVRATTKGFDLFTPTRTYRLQSCALSNFEDDIRYWTHGIAQWQLKFATPAPPSPAPAVTEETPEPLPSRALPSDDRRARVIKEEVKAMRDAEEAARQHELELAREQERLRAEILSRRSDAVITSQKSVPETLERERRERDSVPPPPVPLSSSPPALPPPPSLNPARKSMAPSASPPDESGDKMRVLDAKLRELESRLGRDSPAPPSPNPNLNPNPNPNPNPSAATPAGAGTSDARARLLESRIEQLQLENAQCLEKYNQALFEISSRDGKIAQLNEELQQLRKVKESMMIAEEGGVVRREAFLEAELARAVREGKAELASRDAVIDTLRSEAAELRKQAGGGGLAAAEFEQLRREYFFALAVGIKLNMTLQGMNANLNVVQLWERAKDMPWSKWNGWIMRRFQETN